jgi:AAA family ATP:ADP antiporter
MISTGDSGGHGPSSGLERSIAILLRPFGSVKPSEVAVAIVMMSTAFLLLTGYYLLKTAREPMILLQGGAEVKQYAAAGQALLLVAVVRGYSWLASRVGRTRLLATVFLFFASNLVVFAALAHAHVRIGVAFYLWVGVFNMTAVSQFWSLAADVYTSEQGKRLFAVLGIGSSVGAVVGARIARSLAPLGPPALILGGAIAVLLCTATLAWVAARAGSPGAAPGEAHPEEPLEHDGVVQLLVRNRYLMLIAALTLLLNWARSNGDYVLDRTLLTAVAEAKVKGIDAAVFVTRFKADYFEWVNLTGLVLQLFVVSRVMKGVGITGALLVLPAVVFGEYSMYLVAPILEALLFAKVAESAVEYSLQSTARQALFLNASREEKYVGKTVVDTVVVRAGDALTALLVLAGSRAALSPRAFAAFNMVLAGAWVVVVWAIARETQRRGRQDASAARDAPATGLEVATATARTVE